VIQPRSAGGRSIIDAASAALLLAPSLRGGGGSVESLAKRDFSRANMPTVLQFLVHFIATTYPAGYALNLVRCAALTFGPRGLPEFSRVPRVTGGSENFLYPSDNSRSLCVLLKEPLQCRARGLNRNAHQWGFLGRLSSKACPSPFEIRLFAWLFLPGIRDRIRSPAEFRRPCSKAQP
jgi:hypothetical protein